MKGHFKVEGKSREEKNYSFDDPRVKEDKETEQEIKWVKNPVDRNREQIKVRSNLDEQTSR